VIIHRSPAAASDQLAVRDVAELVHDLAIFHSCVGTHHISF